MLVQTITVLLHTLGFYHLVGYSLFGHMQNADQGMCDDNSTDNLTGLWTLTITQFRAHALRPNISPI